MQNPFAEAMAMNANRTENGMPTNTTSLSDVVDLFYQIGAMRGKDKQRLINMFTKAWVENPSLAVKILFWARDVRGGAGERQIFRDIISEMAKQPTMMAHIERLLEFVPEYGRFDDLSAFMGTFLEQKALTIWANAIKAGNSLAAKWVPRKGHIFNGLCKKFGVTPKGLRRIIVPLSNTVEQKMCSGRWDEIQYDKLPSLAISRYTSAFKKREGFQEYMAKLQKGEVKINVGTLYPHDVVLNMLAGNADVADQQWEALPNYMGENTRGIMPVVDTSGSMTTRVSGNVTALMVAKSLGLYCASKNKGPFKDSMFIFAGEPKFVQTKGTLSQRYKQMPEIIASNTNLEAVFSFMLNQAIQHKLPAADMPETILILSDMEFDVAVRNPNLNAYQMIGEAYKEVGYPMPNVVFWNLCSRNTGNIPVRYNEQGTGLISGFSPTILKNVVSGVMNPMSIMLQTIMAERYAAID